MGGMMGGASDPDGPADDEADGGLGSLLGGRRPPGADEAAAMRQLLEYLDDPRFDRVIVDTAPTPHPPAAPTPRDHGFDDRPGDENSATDSPG